MALKLGDRIKETTSTSGTGTISLGGAVAGFAAFSTILSDGDTCYYTILEGNNWEIGLGTYASSGNTLARTTVLQSSNSDNKITLSGGAEAFITLPADKAFFVDPLNSPGKLSINGTDNYNVYTTGWASFGGNIFSSGGLTLTDSGGNPTITFRESSQIDPKAEIVGSEVDTDNGTLTFKTENAGTMTTAMTISQAQLATFSGGITSTASANTLGATSFNEANITNVGNIALDSITADGSAITITGNTTFADGAYNFDIASHDGSNGLQLGGVLVTSTAAELNIMDGGTSASSTTLADADRIVTNDNGTMKQVALSDVKTYLTSAGHALQADVTALAIALG